MTRFLLLTLLGATAPLMAQLSTDQKVLEFQQLAALYAKQYAPYEWKRDAIGFDLLQLGPWLDRVRRTKDDFEYLDLCYDYVSSLRDGHVRFYLPSNFSADSGLFLDLYDNKVLVDSIDRQLLPVRTFPIQVGDELLSVDGKPIAELITEFKKFAPSGNGRAAVRDALDLIVYRVQSAYPRAHLTPDTSKFQFRRQSNGAVETYDVRWLKDGIPLTAIGPVPSPILQTTVQDEPPQTPEESPLAPRPFRGLRELRNARIKPLRAVRGIGAVAPLFAMPSGFQQRLGRGRDLLFSGTFQSGGLRIGFLRISYMHDNAFLASQALSQIVTEVAFFERNTDGLIVDLMRNPGGDPCFAQDAASLMTRQPFKIAGAEIRATRDWINKYESLILDLESSGSAQWVTQLLRAMLGDIRGAYSENRGRTGPLPLCDLGLDIEPARDRSGNLLGYSKPIMLLTDDYTASAAELFAAAIQDNGLGIAFGMPSQGAGGTVSIFPIATGMYSETMADVTQSLMVRPGSIRSAEYPVAPYLENIGIQPDVRGDLMTVENLRNNGAPFVAEFTAAMLKFLRGE
ncbi:MAG: S41 family peptidase [Bryobacteraceae bacterium]